MKERIMKELDIALNGEIVGFVGVVIAVEGSIVIPTVIDIAHVGLGKIDSEAIRERFRELGKAVSAECGNTVRRDG